VEALQVKGEESTGEYGEKPIAARCRMAFTPRNEPEKRERDGTAEERDDRRATTGELCQRG
jgi:hypothetical protein